MVSAKKYTSRRQGAALLVVLFIVMIVTILSLGFLSRSDVELACGQNMMLRTQMDYLAESGLEHARGLILSPQEIESSEYLMEATGQQLVAGSDDYYDIVVTQDANDHCNYIIDCNSYRLKSSEKIGRSSLRGQLRLDPCVALWTGADTTYWSGLTVNGDVYCGGTLMNNTSDIDDINGDAFASGIITGTTDIKGQKKELVTQAPVAWPQVTADDFTSYYDTVAISGNISGTYDPGEVYCCEGDLTLADNVQIVDGMLIVKGNLSVQGNGNIITAGKIEGKNVPAILVAGDLIVENDSVLDVNGLAVVGGNVRISSLSASLNVVGGLYINGTFVGIEFDGVDDYVEDFSAPDYLNGLSAVTFSIWAKSDFVGVENGIMFSQNPNGSDSYFGIRYDPYGESDKSNIIKAGIRANGDGTKVESTENVQTTSWQHLAFVWESGSSLKLYINGVLNPLSLDEGAVSGTITDVDKLLIGIGTKGINPSKGYGSWDGMLDDMRIYDYAMDAEVLADPNTLPYDYIMHWGFEDTGNSVTVTASPAKTAVLLGPAMEEKWSQAAGAFFKSIERRESVGE